MSVVSVGARKTSGYGRGYSWARVKVAESDLATGLAKIDDSLVNDIRSRSQISRGAKFAGLESQHSLPLASRHIFPYIFLLPLFPD